MTNAIAPHSLGDPWPNRHTFLQRIAGLSNFRHLTSVILKRTRLSSLFTMRAGEVRLRFFPTSMSTVIWENRQAYSDNCDFLRRYLRPGDSFVDIGANIGYLTLTGAKAVGPRGKVLSFEAHPGTFGYLQANVALNALTNVVVNNLAIGNGNGTVDFLECPGDDSQNCVAHGKSAIAVRMVALDEVLADQKAIALLKIDVEGYEKFVLEGAERLLSRVGCVYFECSIKNFTRYGYSCETLLTMLERAGFALFRLDQEVCTRLTTDYEPRTLFEDLIAVREPAEFFGRTGYTDLREPVDAVCK